MTQTDREQRLERGALLFLNDHEARTVAAVAERIVPGDEYGAGATDADVATYVDRALAGFSTALQPVYRLGIRDLDRFCRTAHGTAFFELDAQRQDDVVRRFLGPESGDDAAAWKPAGEDDYDFDGRTSRPADELDRARGARADRNLLQRFFAVIREHTIEGMFCDPAYGGNRNACGWRLVGFPGVQWGYDNEQMQAGFDGRQIPVQTLADLRQALNKEGR